MEKDWINTIEKAEHSSSLHKGVSHTKITSISVREIGDKKRRYIYMDHLIKKYHNLRVNNYQKTLSLKSVEKVLENIDQINSTNT